MRKDFADLLFNLHCHNDSMKFLSYRICYNVSLKTIEPVLFDDSISKNISYGFQGASKEDIMNAAMLANAHD